MKFATVRRRYLALCALFGLAFGIRFTLDVWIFQLFHSEPSLSLVLVAVTLLAMLCGEIIGAQSSARFGYHTSVAISTTALGGWALVMALAVQTQVADLMFVSATLFGFGFGIFHCSLDAWYRSEQHDETAVDSLDRDLSIGYGLYNTGYILGAGIAFPLLVRGALLHPVNTLTSASLSILPFCAVLLCACAIWMLRPKGTARSALRSCQLKSYLAILRSGGVSFAIAVVIGSAVSVLIQYVDHFSPSLLRSNTVLDKSFSLLILNGVICLGSGLAVVYLTIRKKSLTFKSRSWLVVFAFLAVIGLLSILASANASLSTIQTVMLLGALQAILVSLPPLAKSQALLSVAREDAALALSILGAGKRLLALPIASLAVVSGAGPAADVSPATIFYCVLLLVAGAAVLATLWSLKLAYASRTSRVFGDAA